MRTDEGLTQLDVIERELAEMEQNVQSSLDGYTVMDERSEYYRGKLCVIHQLQRTVEDLK